jgi:hypothetical protein
MIGSPSGVRIWLACGATDPQVYLHHVIGRIADHPINRIEELLPWRVDLQTDFANRLAA